MLLVRVDSKDEGTRVTPMWIAEAMVNGEVWGKGRGNTKKAAKNEAAKEGLARLGWKDVSSLSHAYAIALNSDKLCSMATAVFHL